MARVVGIKIKIEPSEGKAGIKDLENETKRASKGMKGALQDALKDGLKGGADAVKSMISTVKSAVGVVGGLLGGLGVADLAKGALEAKTKFGDLRAGIQFAGGSAKDAAAAQAQAQKSALAWGQDSMKVVDAFQAIRGETGSIEFAQKSLDTVTEASRGAHKSLEGMAAVTGTLNEKFGITAEELPDALADIVGLSEKGGVSFEDMSEKLGQVGAFAKQAGLQGREGLATMVGLMNVADNSTGNLKKGMAAVGGLLDQLGNQAQKSKIGAALGISQKDLGGGAAQQIQAIMKATKGQRAQLEKAFGGEQLKVLVDLGKTYASAFDATTGDVKTKTQAGADALNAALTDASKSAVTWSDLQKEAAAQMQEGPQKIAVAIEKLRQAVAKPEVIAGIEKLIGALPKLADVVIKLIDFGAVNPATAITAAIVANIAASAIGEGVSSILGAALKSFPAATIGVGLLAVAAAAAAAAIADYEAKATKQEEALDETDTLVSKAQEQLKTKGAVDQETLDALARQRAEFEAVRGAAEGGGVQEQKYTTILASKIFGGADEIARGEGTTKAAEKLGGVGVEQKIADLDMVIADAVRARRAAAPSGGQGGQGTAPGPIGPPLPATAPAGMDPNTWAQLTGRSTADALGGKVLKVEVVGGNAGGPTGAGPVTPGNRPR